MKINERTIILDFLGRMVETAASNTAKFAKMRRLLVDKTVDGSYVYWSTCLKAYKYAWHIAGGDNHACQAIIERAEREANADTTCV